MNKNIGVSDILDELQKEYDKLVGFDDEYRKERENTIEIVYREVVKINRKLNELRA